MTLVSPNRPGWRFARPAAADWLRRLLPGMAGVVGLGVVVGVRLAGAQVPTDRITAQRILTIPASAPGRSLEIGEITSAVRLANGAVAMADNASHKVHIFDAKGRPQRSIGRDGEGPGEFRALRWIGACGGNEVVVHDYMINRLTFVQMGGNATTVPAVRVRTPAVITSTILQCDALGRMAMVVPTSDRKSAGPASGTIQLFDRDGASLGKLGPMFVDESRPLGASIKLALGDGGMYYGAGDSAFVTKYDFFRKRTSAFDVLLSSRAPTQANRDAAIEYWATLIRGTEREYEMVRTMLRRLPPVTTVPFYSGIFFDQTEQMLWLQTSVLGDANTVLQRYTPQGRPLGRLLLPPNLQVFQIGNGHLVARVSDRDSGEESLVVYRIASVK